MPTMAVHARVNGGHRHPLLLRYPADARQDWIYEEHEFQLWLELTIGGSRWTIRGPKILHPAYEFPSDESRSDLRKALATEYGNPATKAPLHARPYGDCLDTENPVGEARLPYVVDAAAFINGQIPSGSRFSVTQEEIAILLLCEGSVVVLRAPLARRHPDKARFRGYNNGMPSPAPACPALLGQLLLQHQQRARSRHQGDGRPVHRVPRRAMDAGGRPQAPQRERQVQRHLADGDLQVPREPGRSPGFVDERTIARLTPRTVFPAFSRG